MSTSEQSSINAPTPTTRERFKDLWAQLDASIARTPDAEGSYSGIIAGYIENSDKSRASVIVRTYEDPYGDRSLQPQRSIEVLYGNGDSTLVESINGSVTCVAYDSGLLAKLARLEATIPKIQ